MSNAHKVMLDIDLGCANSMHSFKKKKFTIKKIISSCGCIRTKFIIFFKVRIGLHTFAKIISHVSQVIAHACTLQV